MRKRRTESQDPGYDFHPDLPSVIPVPVRTCRPRSRPLCGIGLRRRASALCAAFVVDGLQVWLTTHPMFDRDAHDPAMPHYKTPADRPHLVLHACSRADDVNTPNLNIHSLNLLPYPIENRPNVAGTYIYVNECYGYGGGGKGGDDSRRGEKSDYCLGWRWRRVRPGSTAAEEAYIDEESQSAGGNEGVLEEGADEDEQVDEGAKMLGHMAAEPADETDDANADAALDGEMTRTITRRGFSVTLFSLALVHQFSPFLSKLGPA
ncbi:hypothetical protein DFP72DRAFT_861122 [Ephemerocybe angulata]|uniref:Uncharacterized protein n=1 Tax=Ephemerocybe angulata TaxID=980116 RepID=A0A8H6H9P3_9AGAR|nr:hypothetical protein DFP72DRAFT_861122 [Tulosesus angulatus]